MKKNHLLILTGTVIVLIGLVVGLLFLFLGLYNKTQAPAANHESGTLIADPVEYLVDSWHFDDGLWDSTTNTVTAIRVYDLSYDNGKKIGGQVFTDDLAPDTYLSQALTIAADLNSRYSMEDVTVVISFRSHDGGELFSVDSVGNISTCWDSGT